MSTPDSSRQFWIEAPGRGAIIETELAPPRAGEVVVRTLYSGISRGTESLVFRGEVPPSQYRAMRAPFQEGDFPGPVKYGYASVGEVAADAATAELAGRVVFSLYPHQDVYCVPAEAVTPVPADVPPARAVLAAYMETAVTIVWDARPAVGDSIVVIGAGVLGLLAAWQCRRVPGTATTIVDIDPARAEIARSLGIGFATEPPADPSADLVIHTSGRPEGLRSALLAAGDEGVIVEASWYGSREVTVPLGERFHSGRLTIRSSQVGRIPPSRAPRWSRDRRMRLALELLRAPELDVLISGESDFAELPDVLARVSTGELPGLCHRIRY